MITGEMKNKVDSIWDTIWTGGITSPITVLEQITYLMFMKLLDDNQLKAEANANVLGVPLKNKVFKEGICVISENPRVETDYKNLRWNVFHNFEPGEMLTNIQMYVFPFIKTIGEGKDTAFSRYMPKTLAEIPNAEVVQHTAGGATLADQLNSDNEYGKETIAALDNESWDYIILQEMSNLSVISKEVFLNSVEFLCDEIRDAGAVPVLFATWAYKEGNEQYLFLYDPDHNYIYKATHALAFADCVEFYDDWGWGDSVRLDVYYRMCDQLVKAAKADKDLMAADARRFLGEWGQNPDSLYPDPEKHILAFDLIYCCSTYGLFKGITFERPKSKDRQMIQERKEKVRVLKENLDEARKQKKILEESEEYVNTVLCEGVSVRHKKFGTGVISGNDGKNIRVVFESEGEKKLGTFISVANGLITVDDEEFTHRVAEYKDVLKKEKSVISAVEYAERQLSPYVDYLD